MRSPPSSFPGHPWFPSDRRGFALLITITLLAFLVILLVGLATYTRVETAVAGNTQRQTQARENALLALNVAVAHLQKYAGLDQRVTATADSFPNTTSTRHYTGVWSSDVTTGISPLTWLTSGNELFDDAGAPAPLAVTPETVLSTAASVALIGVNTSGTANDVRAPLVPLTAAGVPGSSSTASPTIGRYAWWIGDQGVKAPVALSDPTTTETNYGYDPLTSTEVRRRLRQQISLGAGSADGSNRVSFEPRDTTGSPSNATLANNTLASSQIAFFRAASGTVNLAAVQRNYFSWSTNNSNVLANTNPASPGLRRDLSLKPDLLGAGFVAWANYNPKLGGYMEDPLAPQAPPRLRTDTVVDPVLHRYRMTPRTVADGIEHRVAPILSFFGLSFSLRNDTANNSPTALEVSARCVIGLWNPYSAGLVPEDLEIKVTGLPTVVVTSQGAPPRFVDLQRRMENADGDVKFALLFTPNGTDPDRSTWLPGRVYNWSAKSSAGDPGPTGYETVFYSRDASQQGSGIVRDGGPPLGPDSIAGALNYRVCEVFGANELLIELRRASTGEKLAEFRSPRFDAFITDDFKRKVGDLSSDFAYLFRLPDGAELPTGETATWLRALGRDPREFAFPNGPQEGYVVPGGQMPNPALPVTLGTAGFRATYSQFLLDRYTAGTGRDFTEDVPVFELPRFSLLSLGALQHLLLPGERPFAVGNSWGGARNAWFDQYFFSGLTPDMLWIDPTKPLPNPRLRVIRRKPDASDTTVADVSGVDRVADGYSSKYLLQDGAFNVNSVSKTAWAAVLRGVRFTSSTNFALANVSTSTGTTAVSNGDATTTLSDPWLSNSRVAAFPRFSQSAQETFKATDGYVQSDPDPDVRNYANTPLFRRGLRFLSTTDVAELADKIVNLVQQKHRDSGPFRTMQEFISPSALFVDAAGGQASLLEKAIEDAQLNTDAALGLTTTTMEFSSQWLTQGDILTALAPVLFPRSDTFLVRSYGEATNPATNATEGRAWCEALVQRIPDYFDPSIATGDPAETAPSSLVNTFNQAYGRRFKIISFRWLTRSDL